MNGKSLLFWLPFIYLQMTIHFLKQLESNPSFAINSLWAPWLHVAEKLGLRKFPKPWTMLESALLWSSDLFGFNGKNKSLLKDNLVTWKPERCNINDSTLPKHRPAEWDKANNSLFCCCCGWQSEWSRLKEIPCFKNKKRAI